MKVITHNAKETKKVAKDLAENILRREKNNSAIVLCLEGDLGAGKTTFTQGFAKGLKVKGKILSPTFIILKRFKIMKSQIPNLKFQSEFKNFYHIDCYRLKNEKDLLSLNFKEVLENPENIILIEWPERIKKILPKNIIKIDFKHLGEGKREINY